MIRKFRRINWKSILVSLDFIASSIISIIIFFLLKKTVANSFVKDLYSIGISVLSIIFSVYFAALSIIISSSDDNFVKFLDKIGKYRVIIRTFKLSLIILFVALLWSIFMYAFASYLIENSIKEQSKLWLMSFVFLFFYGLFAALGSTLDAIKYADTRVEFLNITHQSDTLNNDSKD